ncbi:hypothetical protein pdam_00019419, partial [Pocillopora damicornis]
VQRNASRWILGSSIDYGERLEYLGWPTLNSRREFLSLVQLFKFIMSRLMRTRSTKNVKIWTPYARTNILKNSFWYKYIRIWNDLPNDIISSSSAGWKMSEDGTFSTIRKCTSVCCKLDDGGATSVSVPLGPGSAMGFETGSNNDRLSCGLRLVNWEGIYDETAVFHPPLHLMGGCQPSSRGRQKDLSKRLENTRGEVSQCVLQPGQVAAT